MPHITTPEEHSCHCKEMTCQKDCARKHTHKGFFCWTCDPEKMADMTTPQPQGWEREQIEQSHSDTPFRGGKVTEQLAWFYSQCKRKNRVVLAMQEGEIYSPEALKSLLAQKDAEKKALVREIVAGVKEANNLRQAKIDGKEDWNRAMEQCAAKFDAVISTLTAIAEKHNVQL